MERIRYTSQDDIWHFVEGDTNLFELLRNAGARPAETRDYEDNKKEEKYQFNQPIKIIIPDLNKD